ncbi:MAG TPA: UbiD family decarboxylase [Methylomirabilota bacterium]|nr:UbiD family decarboxylase [Methylomirabilota bacterium]
MPANYEEKETMPLKDIREFIEVLEANQELQTIDQEVDWNLEIGAITRRCCELSGPAPLFTRIKDYPGKRILGNPLAKSSRVALAFEMDADTRPADIIKEFMRRREEPVKPVLVSDGPCKEVKHVGSGVNMLDLPVPFVHQGDGGRYLGTWSFVVNKDPDSGWVNWGMYRQMVHDETTLGGPLIPGQHGPSIYYQKYQARNKPMEFATVIGPDPVSALVSASPVGFGVNEVDIAGALRKEPVELVKCETVDLYVPAHAEIIIEGIVMPNERKEEGPFGEGTGYSAGGRVPAPVYHVQAVTHRKDPIFTMSNMGTPVHDWDIVAAVGFSADYTRELKQKGFPIRDVAYVIPQCSANLVVVSTETPYYGIAKRIASTIWSTIGGIVTPWVIVCNDDVDPTNLNQVMHAVVTKCHPVKGITVTPNVPGHAYLPYLDPHERLYKQGHWCLFDCTWPIDWPREHIPPRSSFDDIYPEEIKAKVLANWSKYGFIK